MVLDRCFDSSLPPALFFFGGEGLTWTQVASDEIRKVGSGRTAFFSQTRPSSLTTSPPRFCNSRSIAGDSHDKRRISYLRSEREWFFTPQCKPSGSSGFFLLRMRAKTLEGKGLPVVSGGGGVGESGKESSCHRRQRPVLNGFTDERSRFPSFPQEKLVGKLDGRWSR